MLFFEPIDGPEKIPNEMVETVRALGGREFKTPFTEDLELINLGRPFPIVEKDGKFIYRGVTIGYLRAQRPSLPKWI